MLEEIFINEWDADAIAEDYYDFELRPDYSGRCMCGETCVGFVVSGLAGILRLGGAIHEVLNDSSPYEADEMYRRATVDGMGLGYIVYFPGVKIEMVDDD